MSREPDSQPGATKRPEVFEAGSSPDPFQVLAAEHALIRLHLARAIEAARLPEDGGGTQKALAVLADSFRLHERREDLVLYPICEQLFGGRESVVAVLRQDHHAIRQMLQRTVDPTRSASVPSETLDELGRLLEGHFAKEERVLFPLMTAHLPGRESARLARRLRATPDA